MTNEGSKPFSPTPAPHDGEGDREKLARGSARKYGPLILVTFAAWWTAAAQGQTSSGASPGPSVAGDGSSSASEPRGFATFWEETIFKHQTTVGLFIHEGVDAEGFNFRPTRELRLLEKGTLVHETQSFHWNLRLSANRDAFSSDQDLDEDYWLRDRLLINGSMLSTGAQLMVRGLYWQKAEETWSLQIGSMQHIWGPADGINTLTVMNPQDLRFGLSSDKEAQYLAVPSAKVGLTQGASTLSIVYAPWAQASLLPQVVHNYNFRLDNQNFDTAIKPRDQIIVSPSVAIKVDTNLGGADLTALVYQGVDYDPLTAPSALNVRNNRPLELDLVQRLERKTSYGLGYNQALGAWALKAEALYTPRKKVLATIDGTKIETLSLPVEPQDGSHVVSNIGFNYFTSIRNFFGISLGETVVTAEYYRQRIFGRDLFPALLSDIFLTNLRTTALDDRIEINLTQAWDLALKGELSSAKVTYAGTILNQSFVLTQLGGSTPDGAGLGSPFFYWRRNDSFAYELTYAIK